MATTAKLSYSIIEELKRNITKDQHKLIDQLIVIHELIYYCLIIANSLIKIIQREEGSKILVSSNFEFNF